MKSNKNENSLKTKELLSKLLRDQLENSISNLEINNQIEISTLSIMRNTSNEIINYLFQLQNNTDEIKEENKNSNQNSDIEISDNNSNANESQNNKNEEMFVEINSILKKKKYNNTRNRGESSENLENMNYNNNTNNPRLRVSFISNINNAQNKSELNITPDNIKRHKPFLNNYISNKKERNYKSKISNDINSNVDVKSAKKRKKNDKSFKAIKIDKKNKNNRHSTPLTLKEKNKNNQDKNDSELNISNNKNDKNKFVKKGYKTSINFYSKKKNKTYAGSSINDFSMDNISDNKIIEDEKNLMSLCDSLLVDVNKDELLVSNSKLMQIDNLDDDLGLNKISFPNLNDFGKNNTNKNSFDEKLNSCIQYFIQFLSIKDILNLCQTKKKILKIVLDLQIKNTKKSIDEINSILKEKNIDINNINDISQSKKVKPFEFNSNSLKSISYLNVISKANFIKSIDNNYPQNVSNKNNNNNISKIVLIFDIYFIALGRKKIINDMNGNNNLKIEYICNYFKNNKNKSIGSIIENELKGKKFDDVIINSLYEYSFKYANIINPNYFKKINKNIAILVFLIKNILDYAGIPHVDNNNNNSNKANEQKIILLNKSRLNANKAILEKYTEILNKFNIIN